MNRSRSRPDVMVGQLADGRWMCVRVESFIKAMENMPLEYLDDPNNWIGCEDDVWCWIDNVVPKEQRYSVDEEIRRCVDEQIEQDARIKEEIRSAIASHDRAFLESVIACVVQRLGYAIPSSEWMRQAVDFYLPLLK